MSEPIYWRRLRYDVSRAFSFFVFFFSLACHRAHYRVQGARRRVRPERSSRPAFVVYWVGGGTWTRRSWESIEAGRAGIIVLPYKGMAREQKMSAGQSMSFVVRDLLSCSRLRPSKDNKKPTFFAFRLANLALVFVLALDGIVSVWADISPHSSFVAFYSPYVQSP